MGGLVILARNVWYINVKINSGCDVFMSWILWDYYNLPAVYKTV